MSPWRGSCLAGHPTPDSTPAPGLSRALVPVPAGSPDRCSNGTASGKLLVCGSLGYFAGTRATGIVRLNATGPLDTSLQLGATDSFAAPQNGGPALTLLPVGDILAYVSSNVSFIRDEPVRYQGIKWNSPAGSSDSLRHFLAGRRHSARSCLV